MSDRATAAGCGGQVTETQERVKINSKRQNERESNKENGTNARRKTKLTPGRNEKEE